MPKISRFLLPAASLDRVAAQLSLAVVVASLGRPDVLAELIEDLRAQSQPPDHIILSVTGEDDLPPSSARDKDIILLVGPKGSCAQRNLGLEHVPDDCDIILFCDDDYVPSRFMAERLRAFFAANPDVAGVSGRLLADGIHGPGISRSHAKTIVTAYDTEPAQILVPRRDHYGLYGCNMAFRREAIGAIRFDEQLPLYGWQEDIDFSGRGRQGGPPRWHPCLRGRAPRRQIRALLRREGRLFAGRESGLSEPQGHDARAICGPHRRQQRRRQSHPYAAPRTVGRSARAGGR
jgi:glycosyltransferase involved in cell wall biosynthesis